MCVPIKIRDRAMTGSFVHEVTLHFHGRKGRPFGSPIPIRIQIEKQFDETELYQTAMDICENQSGVAHSFEDILAALKKTNNNKAAALQLLAMKSSQWAKMPEDDDLY